MFEVFQGAQSTKLSGRSRNETESGSIEKITNQIKATEDYSSINNFVEVKNEIEEIDSLNDKSAENCITECEEYSVATPLKLDVKEEYNIEEEKCYHSSPAIIQAIRSYKVQKSDPHEENLVEYVTPLMDIFETHIANLQIKNFLTDVNKQSNGITSSEVANLPTKDPSTRVINMSFPERSSITKEVCNEQNITKKKLNKKQHTCEMCDYVTDNKSHLTVHIEGVHLNLKKYKCDLCEFSTNLKSSLKRHIDGFHLQLKTHKCDLCDYSSNEKGKIKKHIMGVHSEVKSYKCDMCDYSTAHKVNLKYHRDGVHLKLKQHQCHLCEFSTALRGTLKKHIDVVHMKIKPHKCNVCGFSSSLRVNLQRHIDAVHEKIKKHKCDYCDYSTGHKNNLKAHIDCVHLKLKKFKCDICDFTTALKNSLNRHLHKMHFKDKLK